MVLGTYFLALNGFSLTASDEDYFETARGLASGRIDERRLLDWIRECAVSVEEA
jgi:prophage maintenance system killer protein